MFVFSATEGIVRIESCFDNITNVVPSRVITCNHHAGIHLGFCTQVNDNQKEAHYNSLVPISVHGDLYGAVRELDSNRLICVNNSIFPQIFPDSKL